MALNSSEWRLIASYNLTKTQELEDKRVLCEVQERQEQRKEIMMMLLTIEYDDRDKSFNNFASRHIDLM